MLKQTGLSSPKQIYVESDFYIPIKIRFERWDLATEPRHCWGIYSSDKSAIFEISIGEITGEVKYITLVNAPKIHHEMPTDQDHIKTKIGVPIFETQEWSRDDYHTSVIHDFDVYIKHDRALIVLLPHKIEFKIINDRVIFGFNKDNILCSVEVRDITEEEKSLLEESLKATKAW